MSELLTLSETTKAMMKRLADRQPHEIMEARRRVAGVEISTPSGFEPIGIVTARIVASLQPDAA